ncbi:MAG: HI0074 family nucleotidyltransferase substrate-binding subunit [bacterium]
MKRVDLARTQFVKALRSLEEAVKVAKTDLEIDGVLQRFEFTFELSWKFLKYYFEEQGILVKTPRECFKEAFRSGLVTLEDTILHLIDDRNLTVHLYDKKISREVFKRVKRKYCSLFRLLLNQTIPNAKLTS